MYYQTLKQYKDKKKINGNKDFKTWKNHNKDNYHLKDNEEGEFFLLFIYIYTGRY